MMQQGECSKGQRNLILGRHFGIPQLENLIRLVGEFLYRKLAPRQWSYLCKSQAWDDPTVAGYDGTGGGFAGGCLG